MMKPGHCREIFLSLKNAEALKGDFVRAEASSQCEKAMPCPKSKSVEGGDNFFLALLSPQALK